MKFRKFIVPFLAVLVLTSLVFVGCQESEETIDNKGDKEDVQSQNNESNESENNKDLGYDISKEVFEVTESNTKITYPQVKGYSGELLMDYMNQSLKKIIEIYKDGDTYTDVKIDYEITKMDEKILSVLFKGTGKLMGGKEINIQQSVNLDMTTSNEITYENLIKEDEKSKEEVTKILDQKAKDKGIEEGFKAEGVRVYFKDDSIVFYYMPLDDSAEKFIELTVPKTEIEGYINTEFGEKPAS